MPTQTENMKLYDIDEVATVIGTSPGTVYRHIREGSIKTIILGNKQFVKRSHLEKVVQELNFPVDIIEYRLGDKKLKSVSH